MAKKELDHLTQDALAASRCGMRYGQYKAVEFDEVRTGRRAAPLIAKKIDPGRRTFDLVCVVCGLEFKGGSRLRKYCSEQCKGKADRMGVKKRKENTTKEEEQNDGIL